MIGGDNAGFPNGRRLGDDVVDIELQVVAGILVGNPVPLGDGVDRNDKKFLSQFPYLAAPGLRVRLEPLAAVRARSPADAARWPVRRRRYRHRPERTERRSGGAPSPGRHDPARAGTEDEMKVQRVSGEGSNV